MRNKNPKTYNMKPKDYTVVQVMIAIVLFVISLYFLRLAAALPLTVQSLELVDAATLRGLIIYAVAALASVVLLILNFNRVVFRICKHTLAIAILGLVTCLVLRKYFTDRMTFLYFLHAAFYSLYIVFMLYGTEFFMVSLMTVVSGWSYYSLFPGINGSVRCILYIVALLITCAACVVIAWKASGKKGYLNVFGKKKKLFPASFQPSGVILTAILWILCLLAGLIFGSVFLYYCMFAAIAFELIAAVYYTFQLK